MKTKTDEVMESCKVQIKAHIDVLVENGVRKANIEIELLHYIKKLLYSDGH